MIPGIDAVGQRPDGRRIYFVAADDVIGTMADKALASAPVDRVALRSANFRLQGSGQGSASGHAYLAELPSLVAEITAGTIAVKATMMRLADVEQIWSRAEVPGERTVLVP
jgi:hypothetical protein